MRSVPGVKPTTRRWTPSGEPARGTAERHQIVGVYWTSSTTLQSAPWAITCPETSPLTSRRAWTPKAHAGDGGSHGAQVFTRPTTCATGFAACAFETRLSASNELTTSNFQSRIGWTSSGASTQSMMAWALVGGYSP